MGVPARRQGQWRGFPKISSAALAVCACALGYACGQTVTRQGAPLAPAGSARDDGRGLLARLSAGATLDHPTEQARATTVASQDESGTPGGSEVTGTTHGGSGYGGDTYGGSRYANYRFDRSPRPHVAPLPYAGRYIPVAPAQLGAIDGTVVWPDPPRVPERIGAVGSTAADRSIPCAAGVPNQTLALGHGGKVAGAVVYLEDIKTGRLLLGRMNSSYTNQIKQMQTGGVLEWRACGFHPQVQVVAPIGSVLYLSSVDEAIRIDAAHVDGRTHTALWSVLLGAPGAVDERLLDRHGFLELRAERAGYGASGWVVVAPHPYFSVTDENGHFELQEVPAGIYTLVVWHQPVTVGLSRTGEAIVHSVPPVRRRVIVRSHEAQRIMIKLPPARRLGDAESE